MTSLAIVSLVDLFPVTAGLCSPLATRFSALDFLEDGRLVSRVPFSPYKPPAAPPRPAAASAAAFCFDDMLLSLFALLRPRESFEREPRGVFEVAGEAAEISREVLCVACSAVRSDRDCTPSVSAVSADNREVRVSSESWISLARGMGGICSFL